MQKISAGTIARTIVLGLALINQILAIYGKSPIPVSEEQVNLLISTIITIVTSLIAWWKNNSFTKSAIAADEALRLTKK
ncbi:phage holin [Lactonifactor sp. BIOML-A3]|uniref:phage holin n=1 Tax=unclassified Lactonifactor TaxID=2636670 RepID=UPI0012AF3A6F|nr:MULTISPECIES: phage holin [unclassified Lactonifactor]MSA02927.1 phage holin [Lactonifactor sp. BIOML-A5]MSA10286.1 phage holin [Lactonifactor sp. BIOML-A4]MSA13574.1 phage holin [Lactonifactor sp. BIOML-A3]MSA19259.1 phage holin [Lactonifactor sp. BIOML-A2]MSA39128.1 phage holin [Lactonifactor sp. BIOML-A1]